ncbi:hypothetical protein E5288_WYG003065 [Bos mutus]|uniref:Uncharacterized protein n=1 Tax=Bos mutus TaxID=72004 RepID=A0A6B0R817_9CETA|nr:hypothetical protein [Bos mutus]
MEAPRPPRPGRGEVLLLSAPGERQAFLLKGPSGAELFGRWLLCLSGAPAKPPILEPVPPAGGLDACEELHVGEALGRPDQGGGVPWADAAGLPSTVTAPSCSLSVGWACGGLVRGMSHEPKSPSLGMLSTATRTTATVNPLTPSPLNGALVPSGSPATSSALSAQAAPSSSFAAALRKLAKQAEEPRGSSLSSESSPVSSPATNHSSPASTPKRVPMGPIIVPPGGHSVPSTPPVVTIAPTKTVNGVWRSESRQQDAGSRGSGGGRERLIVEPPLPQEKAGGPAIPSHLLSSPYPFGISPSSVVQDSRFPPLNLQRPVHHVVPPSTVTEDYLRSFRPYHTAEDLRVSSLPPLGLDPATAAAYYHPGYLAPHPFPHPAFR